MVSPFPDDFLWGASTAGHQVEGGNYDQWTVWELAHANDLAKSADKRLNWIPDWKNFKSAGENPENYVSGKGVDHYRRYKEDFDVLKQLNLNSFRFSIEWSRLEPEQGAWDQAAIDHYHNYISELKKRDIEPVLNLWHWTVPVWFDEMGGFTKSGNIGHFLKFVTKIAEEFKDEVKYIITLNEPNVFVVNSYITGEWPPQKKAPFKALKVLWNLKKTHKYSYRILKADNPNFIIGIANNMANQQPKRPSNLLDKLSVRLGAYAWGWWFLNRIKRHQDFVGFNYYMTNYFKGYKLTNPKHPTNDLGWYMEPKGIEHVIAQAWKRFKKPIMVCENGVADADDKYRQWWIKETMQALVRARHDGVDLIGYMHWSLLDNFEWAYGWWPQFGLVHVDRENNMKRTVRPSAKWWAAQLKLLQDGSTD